MKLPSASLGFKLNVALAILMLVLGAATSAIVIYGFNRTQDNANQRSRDALEEEGKLALQALLGGVSDAGALQLEYGAEAGQRAARYLEEFKRSDATDEVDVSRLTSTADGVWYDPDPNRISDVVVPNHRELEEDVVDDIVYSAPLDALFAALMEGFPGQLSGDAYHPVAIAFVGLNSVGRYYPPIGIQETLTPEYDLSNLYDGYGPVGNPQRNSVWTTPYEDPVGQGLVITASTPIYEGDTFRGIIQVDLSIDKLVEEVNNLKPTESGFTFYVDSTGEIMQTNAYDLISREAAQNDAFAAILDSMRTSPPSSPIVTESLTFDGEQFLIAHTPMSPIGGSLAAAAPVDEITANASTITAGINDEGDRTFRIMLIAMALLFVAALASATFLNRRLLLFPLRRLSAGTRAVASGDLDTKVELQRTDELGTLADSFNAMVEQLRGSEHALQRRVDERTRELNALLEVAGGLASTLELKVVMELILDRLYDFVPYAGAAVTLVEGSTMRQVAVRRPRGPEVVPEDLEQGVSAEYVERIGLPRSPGEVLVIDDVRGDSPEAVAYREMTGGDLERTRARYVRSFLVLPLIVRDSLVGMLMIAHDETGFFRQEHIDILRPLADQAAVAIGNARLFSQTQTQARELAALLEVSRAVASTLNLHQLVRLILDEIKAVIDYTGASVVLLGGDKLEIIDSVGPAGREEEIVGLRLDVDLNVGWWATAQEGEAILTEDAHIDSAGSRAFRDTFGDYVDLPAFKYIRSWMGVPLFLEERIVGLLTMSKDVPGYFTQHHVELATVVARQAAVAAGNARLFEQTQRRTREMAALLQVMRTVASTFDINELVSVTLEQLKLIIDHTGSSILVVDDDALVIMDARARTDTRIEIGARFPFSDDAILTQAIRRGEHVIISDVRSDDPMAESYRYLISSVGMLDQMPFREIRSWMGIPMMVEGELVGMLTMSKTEVGYFTEEQARLVRAFADQVALGMERARLFAQGTRLAAVEERQRLARELHDSVSQALYGIALGAQTAQMRLENDPAKAAEPVSYVLSLAEAGLAEMRALIFELRPESLESEGLVAAIQKQAAAVQARHGVSVTCDLGDEPTISPEAREAVYRIVQEALTNTFKHAKAGNVRVILQHPDGFIRAEVADDGVGFDPDRDYAGHLGLHSMRERAAKLGGDVNIVSSPGSGTRVIAEIPVSTPAT